MDQLKKNQKVVFIVLGLLAFIFVAFMPAVDLMGKGTVNGFKFAFEAEGAGFSRFLMFLMILGPIAGGALAVAVPENKWGKNMLLIFGCTAIIGLITMIALPTGCSFAVGSWLSFIVSIAAAVLAYMLTQPAKK